MKKKTTNTFSKLQEKSCEITRDYCEKELVHGMPHINRMLKNFKKLKNKNKKLYKSDGRVTEILDALEFAVKLHDIGKEMEKADRDKKHGTIAIEILEESYHNFFRKIPNNKWIEHAIKGHTDGEIIEKCKIPDTSEKVCFALLLALDNMDAVGEIGVYRDIKDMEILKNHNWVPSEDFETIKKNIKKYFEYKEKINFDKKNNSLLERLLYNYYNTKGNVSRLEKMKSKIEIDISFLSDLYKKLKERQRKYILELKEKKKLEITDSKIRRVLKSPDFCN